MTNTKARVLIVEDDADIREMYRLRINEDGFGVRTAGNGRAGLELFDSFKPHLVLLDVMMPDVNGVDFLASIRRDSANDKVKVIVLTNLDDKDLRKSFEGMNVSDYIVKSDVTPGLVAAKIKTLI